MTWQDLSNSRGKIVHAARGKTQILIVSAMLYLSTPMAAGCYDWDKLEFDPAAIDPHGLIGPPDGKRYLDYEFCVPANPSLLRRLQALSPLLHCRPATRGRSACDPEQALCIGSTASPDWRQTLCRISSQPFVKPIQPTW